MNNLVKTYNYKKAAIVYRGFFIFLLSIIVFSNSFSQEVEIKHYQRKCSMESIVLPGQTYDSKYYSIPFPDSLYSGGRISIKKLKVNKIKLEAVLTFSANNYSWSQYVFKKKHKDKVMKMINVNSTIYTYELKKKRRKYTLVLKLKEDKS